LSFWTIRERNLSPIKEAAIEAIRICKDRGILVNYLKEREKEVVDHDYAV